MKVILLTNIKGNKMWMKGEVLESPFHPDIQGFINNPQVLKIISIDPEPVITEKNGKEEIDGKKENEDKEEKPTPRKNEQKNKKITIKKRK